jgi:hypothetical protein
MLVHFSGEIELVFGWLVTISISISKNIFLLITIEIVILVKKNPPMTFLIRSSNITIIYF